MSVADEVLALRTSVALSRADQLACVRIGGAGAHELLDRVSPRQLFVRSGQILHSLLLDEAARPRADLYICCDDEDYFAIVEGMTGAELVADLDAHAAGLAVAFTDQSATHAILSLDGPYAWELLAEVTQPDVIGLPYLAFFHEGERFTCCRTGKTGEYGYDLIVPRANTAQVEAQILEVGRRFALREIGREAHDAAMLEAGFFRIRRADCTGLTPVELQLQWRVTANRTFPGARAIADRRAHPRERAVYIASPHEPPTTLALDGRPIGRVIDRDFSPTRAEWLGVAVLEAPLAHAGLTLDADIRTISAPAVNNRSLYVDPQRHAFATRDATPMPPLVRPSWS